MTRSDKIKIGGLIAFGLMFFVLVFTVFRCNKSESDYEDKIKALDDSLKVVQIERNFFRNQAQEAIRGHLYADSLLSIRAKQLNIRYEKIPALVNDLDREQLRRAITNY